MNRADSSQPALAYICHEFPKLTETFVYREVKGLRERGRKVKVFAMKRPADPEKIEGIGELVAITRYFPPDLSREALILPPCSPSDLVEAIEAVLEAGEGGLGEVTDFVETAQGEAGEEEVVARLAARDQGVEVVLLTRGGAELDRRFFGAEEDGPSPEAVREAVGRLVEIVDEA